MLIRKTDGSIAMESTLILPLYLTFVLFLIALIKLSIVYMALQQVAHQTVREGAEYAKLIRDSAAYSGDILMNQVNQYTPVSQVAGIYGVSKDVLETLKPALPFAGTLMDSLQQAEKSVSEQLKKPGEAVAKSFLEMRIASHAQELPLASDHITIQEISLQDDMIKLTLEYKFTLPVPFMTREFTIEAVGYERQWVGPIQDSDA